MTRKMTLTVTTLLALLAGLLIGLVVNPAEAQEPDGFSTNRTVSVPAGAEAQIHATSCNESSSNPDGGIAVGGRAEFNENDGGALVLVDEGFNAAGDGWFTRVTNNDTRAWAYLSWADCEPVVDDPTEDPSDEPTTEPTDEPTTEPTDEPDPDPSDDPSDDPSEDPTVEPTETESDDPTRNPCEDDGTCDHTDEPATPTETDETTPTETETDKPVPPTVKPTTKPASQSETPEIDEPTAQVTTPEHTVVEAPAPNDNATPLPVIEDGTPISIDAGYGPPAGVPWTTWALIAGGIGLLALAGVAIGTAGRGMPRDDE